MKLYAPKYYCDFVCIADKCRHSCCIGWEIDVDGEAMKKYRSQTDGYGEKIISTIDETDTPHFRLDENERCPHLDESGLCKIISELGDGFLCDICREHPRFYNDTQHFREVGLGMSCEAACKLILSSDEYCIRTVLGEVDGEGTPSELDTLELRSRLYAILSDRRIPYKDRLSLIYAEFGVSPAEFADSEWRTLLCSLEYLSPSNRDKFCIYSSSAQPNEKWDCTLERALAYFIFRHCTECFDQDEYRCALGFCLFCERLLASLICADNTQDECEVAELARTLSEEIEYSEENTSAIKDSFYI